MPELQEKEIIKEIHFTFIERVLLSTILPQKGSLINMLLGRTVADKVKPTPKEIEASGMEALPDGNMSFKNTDFPEVAFCFEPSEIAFLKDQVSRLDEGNKITFQTLSVCEKIKNH